MPRTAMRLLAILSTCCMLQLCLGCSVTVPSGACTNGLGTTRSDRTWPISGTTTVDLAQSSAFGPRLLFSENKRYDFHRAVDIPTPVGTPVRAIACGKVRIAGNHPGYKSGVVQIRHYDWEEENDNDHPPNHYKKCRYYSNYLHIKDSLVQKNQWVSKGDIVAYSQGSATFDHLHFEVRMDYNQKDARNPWKYLPNDANAYSSFDVDVTLTPNYDDIDCVAVVNVSVPPDQLTFNRVELHIRDSDGNVKPVRFYDMEGANKNHTLSEMDDSDYTCTADGDECDSGDYTIKISPSNDPRFNQHSYANNEHAMIGFEFIDLPAGGGMVMATVFDVFDNTESTEWMDYDC